MKQNRRGFAGLVAALCLTAIPFALIGCGSKSESDTKSSPAEMQSSAKTQNDEAGAKARARREGGSNPSGGQ